jgi:hypothetical protein
MPGTMDFGIADDASAPAVNKLRRWRSPRLLILPSLSLPPLEFCFGSPIQAEKSRPDPLDQQRWRPEQSPMLYRHGVEEASIGIPLIYILISVTYVFGVLFPLARQRYNNAINVGTI